MTRWRGRKLRILDFDTENRPLSYLGSDFTTGEITAIAWQFIGEPRTAHAVLLGVESYEDMLAEFGQVYDEADMVTGHYIRGYDLPVVNGALLEMGRAPLPDKLTHDTKLDLVSRKYLSVSQENLSATLGIRAPKVHMDQAKWREANRLTPEGIELTRKRVIGDVRQHIELRRRLLQIGALRRPRMWSGQATATVRYAP